VRHPAADEAHLLEDMRRPGDYMPVFEDENDNSVMNAKDLRALEHVARLTGTGIDFLKIEGRTKSHSYAARATPVYRTAIDDAVARRPFRRSLMTDLEGLAQRGYTEGFCRRDGPAELQNCGTGRPQNHGRVFVGDLAGPSPDAGRYPVDAKNRFGAGDELEPVRPGGNHRFRFERMRDEEGCPLRAAAGAGYRGRIPSPVPECPLGLLTRTLT
jgi:putative protease